MQHGCLTATALGTVLECWLQDTRPVELAVLHGMVPKGFGTAARQQQPAALPSLQHLHARTSFLRDALQRVALAQGVRAHQDVGTESRGLG